MSDNARQALPVVATSHLAAALCTALALLGGCAPPINREAPRHQVEDAHAGGNALTIAPDSRVGASGGLGGRVRLWQLPEGTALARWHAHAGNVTGLMFVAGGERLLSTGWDGRVRVWDRNGQMLQDWATGAPVASLAGGPAGETFVLGLTDGRVEWWSLDGRVLRRWRAGDDRIAAVAVDGTARRFAAAEESGRVWRWSSDGEPQALARPPTYARSLAFDPGGALVGSGWLRLFRWADSSGELTELATDHRGIINHLEFGPDARFLATISSQTDSAVLLLDPRSGATLRAFRKHPLCGRRVAVSPDGRIMMSTADDASIRFYDLTP